MHDADMGYFSINHPVDRDPVCGYTGIIENECPHCHRKEIEARPHRHPAHEGWLLRVRSHAGCKLVTQRLMM